MPTLGWRWERDRDHGEDWLSEQSSIFHVITHPNPTFVCQLCNLSFPSAEARSKHLSIEHSLVMPVLMVRGELLPRESVLRTTVHPSDLELLQCSRCDVQMDGFAWESLTPSGFCKHFGEVKHATWNIRLVYQRSSDKLEASQTYRITFRIAESTALNEVDRYFIKMLVRDRLQHADVLQFMHNIAPDAPTYEYGAALGNYTLGIILKERQTPSAAPINFGEFANKLRSALDTLRSFNRPVAVAVASSIRFNLNDFRTHNTLNATDVDVALRFLHHITSTDLHSGASEPLAQIEHVATRPICSVDQVSFRLLSACLRLARQESLSEAFLTSLAQSTHDTQSISEYDRAKIHFICAEGYLRLKREADAIPHLDALQFDASFKHWTQRYR